MKSLDKSIRRQEWKVAVAEWQASGLTSRKWCQERNIPNSTFHHWKKLFSSIPKSGRCSFIELPEGKPSRIEMEFEGVKIYAEDDFDEALLIRCLKVLKKAGSC